MEAIWADVIPKLQSIPLPSGATFEDITASVGGDGMANASNQSNFHEEDDEDYSGV